MTLAEVVEKAGLRFVAASSGSTGNAILLNPTAPNRTGVLINGGFEVDKKAAFPESVNRQIIDKFGAVESDKGFRSVEWTERVVREHVLPELKPDVMIDWMTEPDTSGHGSMNPSVVNNTMILWGPAFKTATVIDAPFSNVDLMPTILASLSLDAGKDLDGRVLSEAFQDGPDAKQVEYEVRIAKVKSGAYEAILQYSLAGGKRYIDKSWRRHSASRR